LDLSNTDDMRQCECFFASWATDTVSVFHIVASYDVASCGTSWR